MYRSVAYWVTLGILGVAFVCIHYGPLAVGAALTFIALVVGAAIEGIGAARERRGTRGRR